MHEAVSGQLDVVAIKELAIEHAAVEDTHPPVFDRRAANILQEVLKDPLSFFEGPELRRLTGIVFP